VESAAGGGHWLVQEREVKWEAWKTAMVVCDMWDQHWCPSTAARAAEMAPRMNKVLHAARKRGVFIIHSPSDTMKFYKQHPGRKLARSAPKVRTTIPLRRNHGLNPEREPALPIDHCDDGCDTPGSWPARRVWSRQIETIEILPGDAITDSAEAFYLMRQRGITQVILMGLAANLCVLTRPFGIRSMVYQGQDVLLMRDLTDAMCNPDLPPFVNHFRGTELVVEHCEKYWCPSLTSVDFLGGQPFSFRDAPLPMRNDQSKR
jgi:nicotinamidase-related amidase